MKTKLLATCILSLLALPVWAEGFYVSGDAGRGKWSTDPVSKKATTFYLGAGYGVELPFDDTLEFELGYRDFGSVDESDIAGTYKTDLTATEFSVVASHAINQHISYYGRLGYADVQIDSKTNGGATNSTSENKVFGGIGGRYNFTSKLGIHLEYDRYAKLGDVRVTMLLVGADFRF